MIIILALLFGLIFGSFLNVCIYRMPLNKSIVWPGSGCPKCGAPIHFYDNIPVLSFIILRGKCRSCAEPISWRYPLVELLTGLGSAVLAYKNQYDPAWLLLALAVFYALLVLAFIDLDHFIIPDELSLGICGVGLLFFWVNPNFQGTLASRFMQSFGGAALGFFLLWGIAVAGEKIFKKEAMGGGDIKLMAGLGAVFGWEGVISTLIIGSLLGSVYGLILMFSKKIGRQAPIPFGPFLSVGALINLYSLVPLSAFVINW